MAVTEVSAEMVQQNPDFFTVKPTDYGRFLVISLGTGSAKHEHRYDAESAAKWGVAGWLLNGGSNPLIDIFSQSSADMVDFHLSVVFQASLSEKNYLRIQVTIMKPYELQCPNREECVSVGWHIDLISMFFYIPTSKHTISSWD